MASAHLWTNTSVVLFLCTFITTCHLLKCLSSCLILVLSQTRLSVIASIDIEYFDRNMQIYGAVSIYTSTFFSVQE